eukprot:4857657-Amphidinium_carterae.2
MRSNCSDDCVWVPRRSKISIASCTTWSRFSLSSIASVLLPQPSQVVYARVREVPNQPLRELSWPAAGGSCRRLTKVKRPPVWIHVLRAYPRSSPPTRLLPASRTMNTPICQPAQRDRHGPPIVLEIGKF